MERRDNGMTLKERAERFVALHSGDAPLVLPNPWDVGSARLLEGLGFEALATTSAGSAFALGVPDATMSPGDLLGSFAAIADAVGVPVTGDLEDGFGRSPDTVADTVRAAAEAGLVGGSIEDRERGIGPEPYEIGLASERIAAAVEAARGLSHPFVLTARCENFALGRPDLSDTIERLQAYQAVGADCLYAPALQTMDEVRSVVESVDRPINVLIGASAEPMTVADLGDAGVARITIGSGIARHALTAAMEAAEELRTSGTTSFAERSIPHTRACAIFA